MFKKAVAVVLTVVFLFTLAGQALAEQEEAKVDVKDEQGKTIKSVVFVIGMDKYFINDQKPGKDMDAEPFIENARTYVPVRYLGYGLGVKEENVGWKGEENKATLEKGNHSVALTICSKTIREDGNEKRIDVAPMLKNGRTYLPARFVAEALGYRVEWDGEHNIVLAYPEGSERPDIDTVVEHVESKTGNQEKDKKEEKTVDATDYEELNPKDLNPENYEVSREHSAVPHNFTLPKAKITYTTVEELKEKGPILMGEKDGGYTILHDIKISDEIYIKQETSSLTPASIVLARGDDVTAKRHQPFSEYKDNPFTHGYTIKDCSRPVDMENVTHIMVMHYDQVVAVENPAYRGGN